MLSDMPLHPLYEKKALGEASVPIDDVDDDLLRVDLSNPTINSSSSNPTDFQELSGEDSG